MRKSPQSDLLSESVSENSSASMNWTALELKSCLSGDGRWERSGVVVEVKDLDQYVIRMDGSGRLFVRNRKFLRRIVPYITQRDKPESGVETGDRSGPAWSQDKGQVVNQGDR